MLLKNDAYDYISFAHHFQWVASLSEQANDTEFFRLMQNDRLTAFGSIFT